MVGMSHIWWPEDIAFKLVTLEPEERSCGHCGRFAYVNDRKHRYLHSLGDSLHVVSKVTCCKSTCATACSSNGMAKSALLS